MTRDRAPTHTLREQWRHLSDAERHLIRRVLHHADTRNINLLHEERLTLGDRVADGVARTVGSWRFIIIQSSLLAVWIVLNAVAWIHHWDPYPFILLNLALSFQAAYTAPIIMMSQNRLAAKDRLQAEEDYHVNVRAELQVHAIHERLDELAGRQWDALLAVQEQQLQLLARIEALTAEVHRVTLAADGRT